MSSGEQIQKIIDEIISRGGDIDYLKELKDSATEIAKKDQDLKEVFKEIANQMKEETENFLNTKNDYGVNVITGISCGIYLPDFKNNGEFKLKLIGGDRSRDKELKVDENTLFDIASITKLYTLILLFKLEELGLIDLNSKISDLDPTYKGLEDFTFNDLIRLHGELRTDGNVAQASSYEEALQRLETIYLTSKNREENKYTDFGAIVMSKVLEKVISEKMGKQMTYAEIMDEFLLEPLNLKETMFNPETDNLSGNANDLRQVHDPKSRILGGAVGSAGLFTTSEDLMKLSKHLFSVNYVDTGFISKMHLDKLGEMTFPNSPQSGKGNLGIYIKHPLGYQKGYTPPEYSKNSFSHQGWTGAVASFDPNNLIHQSILVNAIYKHEDKERIKNDKPIGYKDAFSEYQRKITQKVILMHVAKQYYNRYCNQKENIDETVVIR